MALHHHRAHTCVSRLARGADAVEPSRHSEISGRRHVRAEMNMHVNGTMHNLIDGGAKIFLRQHSRSFRSATLLPFRMRQIPTKFSCLAYSMLFSPLRRCSLFE